MNTFDLVTFYYTLTFAVSSVIVILGLMLLGIHIMPDKKLNKFRVARSYLAFSYIVLGVSGFASFFSHQEAEDKSLLAFCTLIIASYQALLFTYTILVLIQPLFIKRKSIFIQLGMITSVGILLISSLFLTSFFHLIFYISIAAYFFQISYYTYIFHANYKACLHALEKYYEDDEGARLQWVKYSFYSALAIGILTLISLFFDLYFYMVFSILYTIYYAYIVCRFYNYQVDFKFAIPVISQDYKLNKKTSKDTIQYSSDILHEKCKNFGNILDKWIEDKKFTQKDTSVDEIAESFDINRSFLQYYFRTYMETDFRTWRSELRIREAQSIIKDQPETSLEEIRELVGFNHRANFHQQFQKIVGITPTEYKRKLSQ